MTNDTDQDETNTSTPETSEVDAIMRILDDAGVPQMNDSGVAFTAADRIAILVRERDASHASHAARAFWARECSILDAELVDARAQVEALEVDVALLEEQIDATDRNISRGCVGDDGWAGWDEFVDIEEV